MRTNIELDDKLVSQAFSLTEVKTKRELIDLALREFVKRHQRKNLAELVGKVHFSEGYDHKALRRDKGK